VFGFGFYYWVHVCSKDTIIFYFSRKGSCERGQYKFIAFPLRAVVRHGLADVPWVFLSTQHPSASINERYSMFQ